MTRIGKFILENLTTGMYSDSRIVYREYIQNACDQIDIAVKQTLITPRDGVVDIFIDKDKRNISIRDTATGVKKESFRLLLGSIADSDKKIGENKGFRGIGRLCGLAYCSVLRFKTSFLGEDVMSIMTCDAKKMREMLTENTKYSVDDIWSKIVSFSEEPAEKDEHFFEVELIDINQENTSLLDVESVMEYLSFVAPVPYKNTFFLRQKVYDHSDAIKYKIDEYMIQVNGQLVFKGYTTNLKDRAQNSSLKMYDEITDIAFHDFYDGDKLIAWMWYGLSRFEKVIPSLNLMRGFRLRSSNIQIGDNDVLKDFFREPRGNFYFVGEIFAVDKGLIPNSQRDYFNENRNLRVFEDAIETYFHDTLHHLYYDANKIKNAIKHQKEYIDLVNEYNQKKCENGFIDEKSQKDCRENIEKALKEAEKAKKQLEKFDNEGDLLSPISKVKANIEKSLDRDKIKREVDSVSVDTILQGKKKDKFVTSTMSQLSRNERKLVSKILSIISSKAPKEVADLLISEIKKEFV